MNDESVDHDRRRVLTAGAAAFAAPLLATGLAHARGTDAEESLREATGRAPGEPSPKSPEEVARAEASFRLGVTAPEGPLAVFAPLALGAEVHAGWTLSEVRAPEKGAMLVVLVKDGAAARVHVCANAGCAAGVASTEALDFLLMNEGHGERETQEDLGLAILALAGRAGESGVVPAGLLTHQQRIDKYLKSEPGPLL